uniref:Uncharacterized protein n=1 Tax=Oryza glaberrima TaxID=4538 RepID=I1QFR6_ORYGL
MAWSQTRRRGASSMGVAMASIRPQQQPDGGRLKPSSHLQYVVIVLWISPLSSSVSDGDQGWVNGACWATAGNLSPTSICTEEARRLDGEGSRVEEARRLILPSLTNVVVVLVVNLHSRVS